MNHLKLFENFQSQFSPELQAFLDQNGYKSPAQRNNHAIIWASINGYIEIVKELLKDPRVDPSADDNYAIRWASEYGHVEVVKELLKDPRVDPSDYDNHAIVSASENDHLEIVKELLKDPRVDPSVVDLYYVENPEIKKLLKLPKKVRDQLINGDENVTSFDEFGFFENKSLK